MNDWNWRRQNVSLPRIKLNYVSNNTTTTTTTTSPSSVSTTAASKTEVPLPAAYQKEFQLEQNTRLVKHNLSNPLQSIRAVHHLPPSDLSTHNQTLVSKGTRVNLKKEQDLVYAAQLEVELGTMSL